MTDNDKDDACNSESRVVTVEKKTRAKSYSCCKWEKSGHMW